MIFGNDQSNRYDLVLSLLAQLILDSPPPAGTAVHFRIPKAVLDEIRELLEEEDNEWMNREMTAELLGTRDFVRLM